MSPGGKHPSLPPRALLVALPLVLPFEAPLLALGPLVVTTVELALYLLLAAWGVDLIRDGRAAAAGRLRRAVSGAGGRDWLGLAVVIWFAAVLLAAALAAPAHRAAALKFALRGLGGGLLFFAARDLVRGADDARRVTIATVTGATVAAALVLAERALPSTRALWGVFRPYDFAALGLPRSSGAFAYPTIAAMYCEAALPLALAIPLVRRDGGQGGGAGRARWRVPLAILLAAALLAALLATATRTALVGASLAIVAMLLVGWRRGGPLRLAAGGTAALLAMALMGTLLISGSGSRVAQRWLWWREASLFGVGYTLAERELTMPAGATREVEITVRNTGTLAWPHAGPDAVRLGYHWQTRGTPTPLLDFEGARTPLAADVPPGGEVRLRAVVNVPRQAGLYLLRWDLVRETVTWFSERGNGTADQDVVVTPSPAALADGGRSSFVPRTLEQAAAPAEASRRELWHAAARLWRQHPLLGVGPDNYRRLYHDVLPRTPGRRLIADERVYANNLYIETLANVGLVGLTALAFLLAAFAGAGRARLGPGGDLLAAAWTIAAGTFFVHGLLDYFLAFTPTYGLYWLALALTGGAWTATGPSPAPPDSES